MSRRELMFLGQLVDLPRCKRADEVLRQVAEQGIAQTIDPFKMFEEEDQPLQMRRVQFAIDAVKRVGDGMSDLRLLQITLQGEDVVANNNDIVVLGLGDAPDKQVNLARVLRKIGRNLFTNECIRKIDNLEATLDRVVIGDRDVIHSALGQLSM